jgi:putative nucleotidyltransferase with HDIG domain
MTHPRTLETHGKTRADRYGGLLLAITLSVLAEVLFSAFVHHAYVFSALGRIAIVFLSMAIIQRFANSTLPGYRPTAKHYVTLGSLLVFSLIVIWTGNIFSLSLAQYAHSTRYLSDVRFESFLFAVPYAAGALLVQSVLGLQYGFVFSISLAILVGVYIPGTPLFMALTLCTSMVACLSVIRLRTRSVYVRAAGYVVIATLPFALASLLIENDLSSTDILCRALAPLVSGGLSLFIAAGLTPVVEYFGGYITDIRLLEMATLDHPLLKELSIQAPGTWNHSMVIGMMVEAAADATGANPVLARVGAYFHDIGKMKKPLYFVENQVPGDNRHDKLSPSMSALIIRSHVKEGVELARQYKLPPVMEDMITQHHGTSLIEYFYDKARKDAEESTEGSEVDESLYRYPGPKPQTREAGILMLADGIEAASRTLSEPTHDRIQGLVQKMTNKVFTSGELNECELTLHDLHIIAKCFTRVLTSIYHQRIAYAEPAEKIHEKREETHEAKEETASATNGGKELAHSHSTKKGKVPHSDRGAKETPEENLKRLGL